MDFLSCNFTEDGREDGAWWSMPGALRVNRMGPESLLGPETYSASLLCSCFVWIGKQMTAFSRLLWEMVNQASRTSLGIEHIFGQWEFKLVVFKGLFKNH